MFSFITIGTNDLKNSKFFYIELLNSINIKNVIDNKSKHEKNIDKFKTNLMKIIEQNKLQDFDDAKLLPSSVDLESLI